MDETERLSSLIGNIYDAALDPALWPEVLERASGYVGGICSAMVAQDTIAKQGQFFYTWGLAPEEAERYITQYIRLNPANMATMLQTKVGDVESTATVVPLEEFFASRFYHEWCKPLGICDSVWTFLEKSVTAAAAVAVLRHERQGLADEDTRTRMRLLAPHFRRAVAIAKVIDLHKVEAAAMADSLDGLASAMFLVDAAGRIAHANAAAHVLADSGNVMHSAFGKLTANEAQANQALHDVFAAVAGGAPDIGAQGIAVPLGREGAERWIAHVLPLTSGARKKAGVTYSAVAAVFVRKAALDLPHPLEIIAKTFTLTPAEMRVLTAVVQIGGVPEVAPILGVSETTVKTHLQHVFAKTGTSRQADLVKLVAGYMSPLAGASA
jgi:DNA-binding CsgD family transcriptional regulator